jgi:diaminopimelate epimerase
LPLFDRIPFVKASAYGNDFLIVRKEFRGDEPAALTRRMCERHNGVGADGVEWLSEDPAHSARIELINADGSFAELSGNGTRCVAAHLVSTGAPGLLQIATDGGVVACTLTARKGKSFHFLSAMGIPTVSEAIEIQVGASARYTGVPVSIGNPHFVIFVSQLPATWREDSQRIQARAELFPGGVNVEWVERRNAEEIAIHIYERGAGETRSSGTGSSASAAAAIATRGCSAELKVVSPGGAQRVQWMRGEPLMLEGSAELICSGEFFL